MKRARTDLPVTVATRGPKRPIDKTLVTVAHTANTVQQSTTLYLATTAVTFSGGVVRGSIAILPTSLTVTIGWAIVYSRQGFNPNTISITNATDFYDPEQDVICSGIVSASGGASTTEVVSFPIVEKIRTMRKMKEGDSIIFLAIASTTNSSAVIRVVPSLFFKQ